MDNMFSKPFMFALSSHEDGVSTLSIGRITPEMDSSSYLVSGTQDGKVRLFDLSRTSHSKKEVQLTWDVESDNVLACKWSKSEENMLLSVANDRRVSLLDTRSPQGVVKSFLMKTKCNDCAWNPQEPQLFALANDDGNAQTFDCRKMSSGTNNQKAKPCHIHQGLVGSVLAVAQSPSGRWISAGGMDCTVRVWKSREARAEETFQGRRVQIVRCLSFSTDDRLVLAGGDDHSIRAWKTQADRPIQMMKPKMTHAVNERMHLKNKYKHLGEVEKIHRNQHVPKLIQKLTKRNIEKDKAKNRKDDNIKAHSKPGEIEFKSDRENKMVGEIY